MSWMPVTWAFYLLILQFETWWEVFGVASMESWTVGAFAVLLILVLLLFAAGGLILPMRLGDYPEDLDEYFSQDGRWAVAVVGLFELTAIIANTTLLNVGVLDSMNLWGALGIVITAIVVGTKRRAVRAGGTVAFGVWFAAYIWMFMPTTY